MLKYTPVKIWVLLVIIPLMWGCKRFDRTSIKMPEFKFVTTENLHSIAAVDAAHVWISGNYGTVLFSSDGGKTWKRQNSGIDELLLGCIRFADTQNGWAAGVGGTIIHTADGGTTWAPQRSGTDSDLLDLFVLDARHAWAVGEFGTLIHTADGGTTWEPQMDEEDVILNDVFFTDVLTGWVVGEYGTILHTADGGKTWQRQECQDIEPEISDQEWERPLPALYGLCFLDARRGWIVGMDGVILKTDDGGTTWNKMPSGTDKPLYSVVINGQRGWIAGNRGMFLASADGGATWRVVDDAIKTKFWLREAAFITEDQGLIVGARGTIVRTDNGGVSWDMVSGFRYDMEEFGLADF